MLRVWCAALASVFVVSLVSFFGIIALSANRARIQQTVFVMVGLAVGAMFGDAFIHLLPHLSMANSSTFKLIIFFHHFLLI